MVTSEAASPALPPEDVRCERAVRFRRATVWNASGGSGGRAFGGGVCGVLDSGRRSGGWTVLFSGAAAVLVFGFGSNQRVMRTASGSPERLLRARSEFSLLPRFSTSPHVSYQSNPS